MDLADPSCILAINHHAAAPPRMEERLVPRHDLDAGAELSSHGSRRALEQIEVALEGFAAPGRGPNRTRRDCRDPPGLEGRSRPLADELAGQHSVMRRAPISEVSPPGLKEGDPLGPVGAVV